MWSKLILVAVFAFRGSVIDSIFRSLGPQWQPHGWRPLGITPGAGELDVEGICTRAGMTCENCIQSVTCVPLPIGWLKVPLEDCAEGFTCNARLGKCSEEPVPECSYAAQEFEHTCEQVGIFPDAYDCRKFHLCSSPEGIPDGRPADHRAAFCPIHYAYNPATAQCSIKLDHSQCDKRPVPDCLAIGQHGVLPWSSNHYYVCLMKNGVLHPQIFICPHGWHFWGEFCQPEMQPENKTEIVQNSNKSKDSEKKIKDKSSEEGSNERSSERQDSKKATEEVPTIKATTTEIYSFFPTEDSTTYAPDTLLDDLLNLANYETTDDVAPSNDEFDNTFENINGYW